MQKIKEEIQKGWGS